MKLEQTIKTLPNKPGVYLFKDVRGKIIYVGKAGNLKKRVGSYIDRGARTGFDRPIEISFEQVKKIDTIVTDSEIEAILLEAELIKRYQPKYNAISKDEKNFNYIRIDTLKSLKQSPRAGFPRITLTRRPLDDEAKYYGPFPSGLYLKEMLRLMRKIFLWCDASDTKWRVYQKLQKPCFYYYIHLCSGVCAGNITQKEYNHQIAHFEQFLKGKKQSVIKELKKEMKKFSKEKKFEQAAIYRDRIAALEQIKNEALITQEEILKETADEGLIHLKQVLGLGQNPKRIECYDISNFAGKEAVGSMAVFVNGVPAKSEYRKFKIKTVKGIDDYAMMREILRRRFKNQQWPYPDLLIVDGGRGHLQTALDLEKEMGIKIPTISLTKQFEEIWAKPSLKFRVIKLDFHTPALKLVQRLRDEAHRFAVTYHEKLRDKKVLSI